MPSIAELRKHLGDNVKTNQTTLSSDNLGAEEKQFLRQYNTTLANLISVNIDAEITAENFFETPNTYDKNYVRMYYAMLERLLYSCTYKENDKKSLKLYNSYCNLLDKLEKKTLKKLEKENRIISDYCAYRLLYKNLQLAEYYIGSLKKNIK